MFLAISQIIVFVFCVAFLYFDGNKQETALSADDRNDDALKQAIGLGGHRQLTIFSAKKVFYPGHYNFHPFFKLDEDKIAESLEPRQKDLMREIQLLIQKQKDDVQKALVLAQGLIHDYPLFYGGYFSAAQAYQKMHNFDKARTQLEEGIKHAQQKYMLYAALGGLNYEEGFINDAVGWWIKSIVSQVNIGIVDLSIPFILLGYTSRYYRLPKIAQDLFALAHKADHKPRILSEYAEEELIRKLQRGGSESIHAALLRLYTEYVSKLLY